MGSFSIWHWLIVLLIVVMVFGTKKLKNMGSDLGAADIVPAAASAALASAPHEKAAGTSSGRKRPYGSIHHL